MKLTDDLRTARATYERQLCAELRQHAARSTQPPSDSQVLDLWAHLRNIRDDGTHAWVMVHKIIDAKADTGLHEISKLMLPKADSFRVVP